VHTKRLTGWKLLSTPGERVVHLFDPAGEVLDIDVGDIPRDGSLKPFDAADGRRHPPGRHVRQVPRGRGLHRQVGCGLLTAARSH